jgi:hypothetical protein
LRNHVPVPNLLALLGAARAPFAGDPLGAPPLGRRPPRDRVAVGRLPRRRSELAPHARSRGLRRPRRVRRGALPRALREARPSRCALPRALPFPTPQAPSSYHRRNRATAPSTAHRCACHPPSHVLHGPRRAPSSCLQRSPAAA